MLEDSGPLRATAAGIASRPRIWGTSSKVGLLDIYSLLVVGAQTKGNAKCSQQHLSCLVCSVEIYEWTLQAPAQTAQQFDLTRSTARGFSAWQLSEEHRQALQRQAEEHHRDYG